MGIENKVIVKQVLVVGLGLIGGSFARALKLNGSCERVLGSTRSEATLQKALDNGVIDWGNNDLQKAAAELNEGDVILIATPTLTVPEKLAQLKDVMLRGVIVTDAASVKGYLAHKAEDMFGKVPTHLVLGHPIAGSEQSGIDAIDATLFENHSVILTPVADTNTDALTKIKILWESVGGIVSEMPIEDHDRVLAATSHLPHVLAYGLVDSLARRSERKDIFTYAAGGFRDFTRIASSDPQMWHDIVIANREALLVELDRFQQSLGDLRLAIDKQNSDKIIEVFRDAKAARDKFVAMIEQRKAGITKS